MRSLLRALIFPTVFVSISIGVQAQQQDKEQSKLYMEQANEVMAATKAMDDARDIMVIAADYDTTNMLANYQAGTMYLLTINKDRATKYFLRVYRQNRGYKFDIEYLIGKGFQLGLDFNAAIQFYSLYKTKIQKNPTQKGYSLIDVNRRLEECKNGKEFIADPQGYSIVNLGKEVNSEFEDYGPVLSDKEDEIVFTTRRRDGNTYENVADDNKPYEDVFITKRAGEGWTKAKKIGPKININFNDSNLAFSSDGNTLFVYKDPGDIYYSTRQKDGSWSTPEPLPGLVNSSFRESSVSLNKEGTHLYFSSDRPGGLGGSDIYVVTKDSHGEWTRIKNMGPQINSDQDEDGPFIDSDEKVLYFSSKGKKGMGGFDIFKSTVVDITKGVWSEPVNLGYPINTPDDDIYYVATKDGKHGYYSSVRDDGLGYSDLYVINISDKPPKRIDTTKTVAAVPEPVKAKDTTVVAPTVVTTAPVKVPVVTTTNVEPAVKPLVLHVIVTDGESQSPLTAKVKLIVVKDNSVVGVEDKGNGIYDFTINAKGNKNYRFSAEREGYVFINQNMALEGATPGGKTVDLKIELRKLRVGVSGVLRNIYFDFDMATFKQESYAELNKLEEMMKQNSSIKVEIGGHTDYIGTKEANMQLSLRRANAVRSFLTSKGIDPRRIAAVGYGKSKPLASNDDEKDGRELNRRVEFKVTSN